MYIIFVIHFFLDFVAIVLDRFLDRNITANLVFRDSRRGGSSSAACRT